jgi:hypothetical protein
MRKPDLIIGPRHDPQTVRWHIFKWRGWQLSIHKWLRSDSDRALHDHKADNLSIILNGGYWERFFHPFSDPTIMGDTVAPFVYTETFRWPLVPYFRKAETPHSVRLPSDGKPVWTIWLRWPPKREWGYWCEKGWVHNELYNKVADYYAEGVSEVGRGCE